MGRTLQRLIGCVLPFVLVVALPLLGVSEVVAVVIFLLLVVGGCHVRMHTSHQHGCIEFKQMKGKDIARS